MAKSAVDLSAADKTIAKHSPKALTLKTIKTEADYLAVSEYLKEIKGHLKALKKDSEEIIRPIRAGLDKLYEKVRNQRRALESLEGDASGVIDAWIAKKQKKAIAAAEKKAAKAPNKEMAADIVDAATRAPAVAKVAGLQTRTVWEVEVTDRMKVPTDVMGVCVRPVDVPKIKKIIQEMKGNIEIPGITFKQVQKVGGGR